jgi:hypothetical protein
MPAVPFEIPHNLDPAIALPASDEGSSDDLDLVKSEIVDLITADYRLGAVPVSKYSSDEERSAAFDRAGGALDTEAVGRIWMKDRVGEVLQSRKRLVVAASLTKGYGGYSDVQLRDVTFQPIAVTGDVAVGSLRARFAYRQLPSDLVRGDVDSEGYIVDNPEVVTFQLRRDAGSWKLDRVYRLDELPQANEPVVAPETGPAGTVVPFSR